MLSWCPSWTLALSRHLVTGGACAITRMDASGSKPSLWTVWSGFRQERLLSQHGTTKAEHKAAAKGKERVSCVDPPTLITVLSVTSQRAFSLAFPGHMVAGNSFWTGALLLTADSISTRVTFYRRRRKEGRPRTKILLIGGLVSWPTQFAGELFFSLILFSKRNNLI